MNIVELIELYHKGELKYPAGAEITFSVDPSRNIVVVADINEARICDVVMMLAGVVNALDNFINSLGNEMGLGKNLMTAVLALAGEQKRRGKASFNWLAEIKKE